MEATQVLEYCFKGLISLGVGMMIYILKDFKTSLKQVTDSLTEVTLTLKELMVKDNHKDETIAEIKSSHKELKKEVDQLRNDVMLLKLKKQE